MTEPKIKKNKNIMYGNYIKRNTFTFTYNLLLNGAWQCSTIGLRALVSLARRSARHTHPGPGHTWHNVFPAVPRSPGWPTDHCSSLAASVVISRSRIASPGWHTDHCSSLASPGWPGDTGHELWASVSTLKLSRAVQRQSWIRERPWKRREYAN